MRMKKNQFIETIIIGAGLSGLAAGKTLLSKNRDFIIIEQNNKIGGKVNTEIHNGYKLDYGFQIILDGYENTKKNNATELICKKNAFLVVFVRKFIFKLRFDQNNSYYIIYD